MNGHSRAALAAGVIIGRAAAAVASIHEPRERLAHHVGLLSSEIRKLCDQLAGYANVCDEGEITVDFALPGCTAATAVFDTEDGALLAILVNGANVMDFCDSDAIDAAMEAAERQSDEHAEPDDDDLFATAHSAAAAEDRWIAERDRTASQ